MDHFIVSARKYRPARFEEVMGQDHVAKTLKNALRTDHLAHAFLFCGPRGVGKTTTARILAKTINCENLKKEYEPCNDCKSCHSFDENSSFNIVEIDAASHNSVDNMRSLVEQIRFTPPAGGYKVYIIDEVHMLSASAFNAFLKTLEEPPAHAIFILATTEKHKIIPTILSRCQVFDFKRIQVPDIVTQLQNICASEEIEAEEDALILIGQKADGALRDALSIFDRVVSLSGKKLRYQDVIESLNLLDYDYFFKLTNAILQEDMTKLMQIFDEVLKNGFEGELVVGGLAAHFRDLLMCKDTKTVNILDHGQALKERYVDQSQLMDYGQLLTFLNIANECDVQLYRAQNKRLQVELMLAKLCFFNRMKIVELPSENSEKKKQVSPKSKKIKPEKKQLASTKAEDPKKENIDIDHPIIEATDSEKINPLIKKNHIVHTPQLGSLLNIESKVKKSVEEAKALRKELTNDELIIFWEGYTETIQSPSVKSTLIHAKPSIKEGKVSIAVGTQTARTRILEENDLIESIRIHFKHESIELDVWVDSKMGPFEKEVTKPKKLLTNKEKYLILSKKNPLMRDLKNTLDLIVDQEN